MPGYSYYEEATAQPIAAAVAEYLTNAPARGAGDRDRTGMASLEGWLILT